MEEDLKDRWRDYWTRQNRSIEGSVVTDGGGGGGGDDDDDDVRWKGAVGNLNGVKRNERVVKCSEVQSGKF
jgi:hypothetical protein